MTLAEEYHLLLARMVDANEEQKVSIIQRLNEILKLDQSLVFSPDYAMFERVFDDLKKLPMVDVEDVERALRMCCNYERWRMFIMMNESIAMPREAYNRGMNLASTTGIAEFPNEVEYTFARSTLNALMT